MKKIKGSINIKIVWRGFRLCALAYTLLLLPFVEAGKCFAQQDPQYSQYMFNQLAINPAYAGSKEAISTGMFLRYQWLGIEGAPATQTITVHGPMRKKKVALGFTIISDQIGPKNSIGALGSYAYRIKIKNGKLSLGLRAGFYQYNYSWDKISHKDNSDPVYNTPYNDQILVLTADAGVYYYTNTLYAGFSATHLNRALLTNIDSSYNKDSRLNPHLFFTFGKAWELSDKLIFSPSAMIKVIRNSPVSADLNFSFLIQKRLWIGLSARVRYGIVAYTQFNITDKFKIGYAYDFGINKIGSAGGGSHEIMLSYDFKISKPSFFSPRYF